MAIDSCTAMSYVATLTHNFKWVKKTYICLKLGPTICKYLCLNPNVILTNTKLRSIFTTQYPIVLCNGNIYGSVNDNWILSAAIGANLVPL